MYDVSPCKLFSHGFNRLSPDLRACHMLTQSFCYLPTVLNDSVSFFKRITRVNSN